MPYPGVEIFRDFHRHEYQSRQLVAIPHPLTARHPQQLFDWGAPSVNAELRLPAPAPSPDGTPATDDVITGDADGLGVDWTQYRTWDLVELTQNYLLLFLKYIRNEDTGTCCAAPA